MIEEDIVFKNYEIIDFFSLFIWGFLIIDVYMYVKFIFFWDLRGVK